MDSLVIDERYRGFPGVALGGISGGLLARRVGTEAAVTFERPVPTGQPLTVVGADEGVELRAGEEVLSTARPTTVDVAVPRTPTVDEATEAARSFLGRHEHPFPSCFACGSDRDEGDGLRLFAGPVGAGGVLAAPWTPHENHAGEDGVVPHENVWAALDCPAIWAVMEDAPSDSPDHVVTAELAVGLFEPVVAREPHVVVAWPLEHGSGTRAAGAAVVDGNGAVKAVGRQTLVVTERGVPLGLSRPDGEQPAGSGGTCRRPPKSP